MYCENCGTPYENGDQFCIKCGNALEVEAKKELTPDLEPIMDHTPRCPDCGMEIEEGEKYCIRCGTLLLKKENRTPVLDGISAVQTELSRAFSSNKILAFLSKYAVFFALYYPINLLMYRFEILPQLINTLDFTDVLTMYAYYISIVALYANRKYIPILIAVGLRAINSISWLLIYEETVDQIQCITRLLVIGIAVYYIAKQFSQTSEYAQIRGKLNLQENVCSQCGANVKTSDSFCPKCGNKMGG